MSPVIKFRLLKLLLVFGFFLAPLAKWDCCGTFPGISAAWCFKGLLLLPSMGPLDFVDTRPVKFSNWIPKRKASAA